ncbi:hypothetical protein K432DRAFT_209382 [Lepidopterella palustris CBS 459.81]|uniref:Uncharacterized protein n=1 Tax=Lepidopterella palustris CBS 459.81 TaxID=1314670 RepID=A0A8E2J9W9_9PEZI|nr:hypothetical protein K432DRAFT_209382 [Lepidopterella palustris CBS 459.81]
MHRPSVVQPDAAQQLPFRDGTPRYSPILPSTPQYSPVLPSTPCPILPAQYRCLFLTKPHPRGGPSAATFGFLRGLKRPDRHLLPTAQAGEALVDIP